MGLNFDQPVLEGWNIIRIRKQPDQRSWNKYRKRTRLWLALQKHYRLDNIDKNISRRFMRVDNQVKSIHYIHVYAALNRVITSGLCNDNPISTSMALQSLPESTFLPSLLDCKKLKENFAVLVGRVIVDILLLLKVLKIVFLHIFFMINQMWWSKSQVQWDTAQVG